MSNYCCFLPKNKITPINQVRDLSKKFNGHYIGIGYIFPQEHEQNLKTLCSQAHVQLHQMPMGQANFKEFVDSYKLDYLKQLKTEKQLKLNVLLQENGVQTTEEISHNLTAKELADELEELTIAIQKRENAQILENASNQLSQYEILLKTPNEQEIAEEIRKISPGIPTGYMIDNLSLNLEGGEISVIAAPTGHGKTSFIINILSQVLENNPHSSVYLFSYEEARAPIVCLALNCFIGRKISQNNRESIKTYFREGNVQFISENMRPLFVEKKNQFFDELIQQRRLNVFYSSYSVEDLVGAIHFLAKQTPKPSVICIDYMQLLRLGNPGKISSRQEELKQICLLLKDCAVETGLPILIAAQFNRTVQNERELLAQAIGEAGDIERIAALILGLWNKKFSQERPEEAIHVKVLKGRNIPMGAQEIFDFDGNACKITNRLKTTPFVKPLNDLF